jgi:hypothetical protein
LLSRSLKGGKSARKAAPRKSASKTAAKKAAPARSRKVA